MARFSHQGFTEFVIGLAANDPTGKGPWYMNMAGYMSQGGHWTEAALDKWAEEKRKKIEAKPEAHQDLTDLSQALAHVKMRLKQFTPRPANT